MSTLYSPDEITRNEVRKRFGISKNDIERCIDIIIEWMVQMPHIPKLGQNRSFIESILVRNKFSIERSKERIEKYYSMKAGHIDYFVDVPVLSPSENPDALVALPYLTDDYERIIIVKINHNQKDFDVMQSLKHILYASEFYLRNDYVTGIRIVQDFQNLTFAHFTKYASKFSVYGAMYQEVYASRVLSIEYINLPAFLDMLMQGCRALLPPKIFERITIHKNLESLHKNIDRKYLPVEYGGTAEPLQEYLNLWDQCFCDNLKTIEKWIEEKADESLRVGGVKRNENFGVEGSFRSLNLD